jgi:hypothetical protein
VRLNGDLKALVRTLSPRVQKQLSTAKFDAEGWQFAVASQGDFTAVLLRKRSKPDSTHIGVSKTSRRDAARPKVGLMVAAVRAVRSAVKEGGHGARK